VRRAAGALTEQDLAAIRGITEALTRAAQPASDLLASIRCVTPAFVERLGALTRASRLAVAYDAAPRHRVAPARVDVDDWLGRHLGDATPDEVELYQLVRAGLRPASLLPGAGS